MTIIECPEHLGARGREFWDQTVAVFGLSESELLLLTQTCRCLDAIESLDDAVRDHGTMVTGSRGQQVVNPAVSEARAQRLLLRSLLAALAIPDSEGQSIPTARRASAKAAANARWSPRMAPTQRPAN